MPADTNWFAWALMSAVFAALTAIFAKVGLEGVNSDLATLIRTAVIIVVLGKRPSLHEWIGIAMVGGGVLILGFKR
jgi:uncharacterized membrane protein